MQKIKTKNISADGKVEVHSFFYAPTWSITHIVVDRDTSSCAIIDSVLGYNPTSGEISTEFADKIIREVQEKKYTLEWILETHAHADHLSAAQYIQKKLGGTIGIGEHIQQVQQVFGQTFGIEQDILLEGKDFDALFKDDETFLLGSQTFRVVHTPGHTPADVMYIISDFAFVGDTIFVPDFGTARTDFPGGNAEDLFDSIQKIYALPDAQKLFMCHDYLPKEGRKEYVWETTVAQQKKYNIHCPEDQTKEAFVQMRTQRDATLSVPKLLLPSIQINIRAGKLPKAEKNNTRYIKIPLKGSTTNPLNI